MTSTETKSSRSPWIITIIVALIPALAMVAVALINRGGDSSEQTQTEVSAERPVDDEEANIALETTTSEEPGAQSSQDSETERESVASSEHETAASPEPGGSDNAEPPVGAEEQETPSAVTGEQPPPGYTAQGSYTGDCASRPADTVCIGYKDGYTWLVHDSIRGWSEEGELGGKVIAISHGSDFDYYHLLDTVFVAQRTPQFVETLPYNDDCSARPATTVCLKFSDGYIWLIEDAIQGPVEQTGFFDSHTVEARRGFDADYYHVIDTNLIKTVPRQ